MSPCKGCQDRSAECHGKCERYEAYRAEIETRYQEKKMASELYFMRRERVEEMSRTARRRRQRKGKLRIGG